MNKHSIQEQNRRQLLTGALRYAALGLLGTAGSLIFVRRRKLLGEGKCINRGICRGCEVFGKCNLPQAMSANEVLARIGNGEQ